ncbi:MAG: hypothetical protein D6744_17655 [Planctomycetota bacterium]|nr:MAG: hypothetical protein D6744_17655 [Planctomycetota bacterium]
MLDALYRKGRAISFMLNRLRSASSEAAAGGDGAAETSAAPAAYPWDEATLRMMFEENFAALARWVDTTEKDYVLLHIARERLHGRLGEALKLLNKRIADDPEKRLYEKRIGLLEDLGWRHWAEYERRWQLLRYPAAYPRF